VVFEAWETIRLNDGKRGKNRNLFKESPRFHASKTAAKRGAPAPIGERRNPMTSSPPADPKTLSPEILAEAATELQRVLDQQPQLGDFGVSVFDRRKTSLEQAADLARQRDAIRSPDSLRAFIATRATRAARATVSSTLPSTRSATSATASSSPPRWPKAFVWFASARRPTHGSTFPRRRGDERGGLRHEARSWLP
jgi:hypothetical protein